jgi:hypothetical protein
LVKVGCYYVEVSQPFAVLWVGLGKKKKLILDVSTTVAGPHAEHMGGEAIREKQNSKAIDHS